MAQSPTDISVKQVTGDTAEKIYLNLVCLPHSQWEGIIANLNSKIKQELLQLIRDKSSNTTQAPVRTKKRAASSCLKTRDNVQSASSSTNSKKKPKPFQSIEAASEPSFHLTCNPNVKQNSGEKPDYSHSLSPVESSNSVNNFSHGCHSSNDKPSNLDLSDTTSVEILEMIKTGPKIKILNVQPLHRVRYLMFVAGDSNDVLYESERTVHRYLNFWLAAFFADMGNTTVARLRESVTSGGATTSNDIGNQKMDSFPSDVFWPIKKKITQQFNEYVKKRFPLEVEKYERDLDFHKCARSSLLSGSLHQNTEANVSDPTIGLSVENQLSLECADSSSRLINDRIERDTSSVHDLNGKCQYSNSILKNIRAHLMPQKRFATRLIARDIRTKKLSTFQYKEFTKSREKSLRSARSIFVEWINMIATLICTPPNSNDVKNQIINHNKTIASVLPAKRNVPIHIIDIIMFLVSDRIATIVELALKIRAYLRNSSEEDSLSSFLSLRTNPGHFVTLWNEGCRLTNLESLMESEVLDSALLPQHYYMATVLLIQYVDYSVFPLHEDLLEAYTAPSVTFPEKPNVISFPSETKTSVEQLLNSASSHSEKPFSIGIISESSSPVPPTELLNNVESAITPQIHSEQSVNKKTVSKEAEDLFTHVIAAAVQSAAPLKVLDEISVFAFLYCRDLFWTKRHQPTKQLWNSIEERFVEVKSDKFRSAEFEEKYFKILHYSQALHKIAALGEFFETAGFVSKDLPLKSDLTLSEDSRQTVKKEDDS